MKRHHPGFTGRNEQWTVTVADAENTRVIFHTVCEDKKEAQWLANEARGHNLAYKIWLRDPYGTVTAWD